MKYNVKEIMTRAWEIKRENSQNVFAICLKMAWAEAKEFLNSFASKKLYGRMTEKQKYLIFKLIKELENKGVKLDCGKHLYYAENNFDMYRTSKDEASKDIQFLLNLKKIA